MKRTILTIMLLGLLAAPAHAATAYRLDCESVAAWRGHVGNAAVKLFTASVSATLAGGIATLANNDAKVNGSVEKVGASLTLLGQNIAAYISPIAIVDLIGAVVCIVPVE